MTHARCSGPLRNFREDLFLLAPIPLVLHQRHDADLSNWHNALIADAKASFSEPVLEVPDTRHVHDLGDPPAEQSNHWKEAQPTAVGIWHRVPTNQFLSLKTAAVVRLRKLIEARYLGAISAIGNYVAGSATITESWIQFYKDGDYKVLHNHERYGAPYPADPWAGAYYIDCGQPDPTMPYAGVLSFRIRNENHYFRPSPGLLLMWPADILHEVHPFYGSRERIVVNFNISSGRR